MMDPDAQKVHDRRWWTLAVLCLSLMIIIVGNSSMNLAIPTFARELDASTAQLQWVVAGYSLVFASLLLSAGAIGDRFGRKGALEGGLAVFLVCVLVAAWSQEMWQIIILRCVMGAAAAFIMPSTLSILVNVFDSDERPKAIAIWASVTGAASVFGPIGSGFVLDRYWWGSVFLINVPLILLALIGCRLVVPRSRDPQRARLDIVGALLSTAGLVAVVYGLIEAPEHGWTSATTLGAFAVGDVDSVGIRVLGAPLRETDARPRLLSQPGFRARHGRDDRSVLLVGGVLLSLHPILPASGRIQPAGCGHQAVPARRCTHGGLADHTAPDETIRLTESGGRRFRLHRARVDRLSRTRHRFAVQPRVRRPRLSRRRPRARGTGRHDDDHVGGAFAARRRRVGHEQHEPRLGAALGVAVLGSTLNSTYVGQIGKFVTRCPPAERTRAGVSLAGALDVGSRLPLEAQDRLVLGAKQAFVDGMHLAMAVGVAVALATATAFVGFRSPKAAPQPVAADVAETARDFV